MYCLRNSLEGEKAEALLPSSSELRKQYIRERQEPARIRKEKQEYRKALAALERNDIDAISIMPERYFHMCVSALAREWGWLQINHTANGKRSDNGFPDMELVHRTDGRHIYAELKTETGSLSDEQVVWRNVLVKAGNIWFTWHPSDWRAIKATLQ